jgi:hypothetical protein
LRGEGDAQVTQQKGPWEFDRRARYLLEYNMDENESIRFGIEGMDGQLIIALDERLLVVKPGFVRGEDVGGLVASIFYSDITGIEIKAGLTNRTIKIHASGYQLNESDARSYQGNQVMQEKDYWLSNHPDSIPITRWGLKKCEPYLYMIEELVRRAKEA